MVNNLKILVLEDDIMDVELISRTLERAGMIFNFTVVDDRLEYEAALGNYRFDVILADNSLPQFDALGALRLLQMKNIETPFILVTGTVSEEFAVDVIQRGADDYILKHNLKRLPEAIHNAIAKWKIKKEKAMADKALRESEQRYRLLFEQAVDGIVISDARGRLLDANSSACQITGYSLEELKQMTISQAFWDEELGSQPSLMQQLLAGKAILEERRVKRKDDSFVFVELSAKLLPDGRVQAVARDISYRKQLEDQLVTEKISHQKKLAQATLDVQEKEREELGHELHDNINQILTATKLLLNAAIMDPSIKDEMLQKSLEHVTSAIEETRKLSRALVAPAVNELSLLESIRDLCDTIEITTPLAVDIDVTAGCDAVLSNRQQITFYRIVQEQLNHIVKHAQAHNVQISLSQEGNAVSLTVSDDGDGFDANSTRAGVGFTNMQSRAELLNGWVDISSEPGRGSTLKVQMPLEPGDYLSEPCDGASDN